MSDTDKPTFYKTMNGTAGAYGYGYWSLPRGKRPGKWMPKVKPVLCQSGYHVCRDLREALFHIGPQLYEVEVRGKCVEGDDKAAYEQARLLRRVTTWNDETIRLFAVDCARLAVNRYAQDDQREVLHACLDVAIGFILGYVDHDTLYLARTAAEEVAAWCSKTTPQSLTAWAVVEATAGSKAWCIAKQAVKDSLEAAVCATDTTVPRDTARRNALSEMATFFVRYIAGEQGPFIEED